MSITNENYCEQFLCDAATTEFAVSFEFASDENNLTVIHYNESTGEETVLEYGSGAGKWTLSGATITTGSTYAATVTLIVVREMEFTQDLDLEEYGALSSEALEDQLDACVLQAQDARLGGRLYQVFEADYTVTDAAKDMVILVDTGDTTRTITLPTAAANRNRRLTIKKVDAGTGDVTIDGEGAETIDGVATQTLGDQYDVMAIICDGIGWYIIGEVA